MLGTPFHFYYIVYSKTSVFRNSCCWHTLVCGCSKNTDRTLINKLPERPHECEHSDQADHADSWQFTTHSTRQWVIMFAGFSKFSYKQQQQKKQNKSLADHWSLMVTCWSLIWVKVTQTGTHLTDAPDETIPAHSSSCSLFSHRCVHSSGGDSSSLRHRRHSHLADKCSSLKIYNNRV